MHWQRRPLSAPRARSHRRLLLLVVGLLVGSLLYASTPLDGWVLCPIRQLFDVRCPGCGMTRACEAAIRGQWWGSLQYHPFGLLLIGGASVRALQGIVELVRGRAYRFAPLDRVRIFRSYGWYLGLAGVLTFWIARGLGWGPW
jgi:hypothetical protein